MVDVTLWLTLLYGWHFYLVDITFWLTYFLVDITFQLTLLLVDITFWLTLLFVWHYFLVDIALYCIVLKFHCSRLPGTWLKVCGGWWWVSQTNYRVTPTWLLQDRSNKLQVILRFEAQLERMTVTPATSYCYCWFADLQDSSYKLHMNLR